MEGFERLTIKSLLEKAVEFVFSVLVVFGRLRSIKTTTKLNKNPSIK